LSSFAVAFHCSLSETEDAKTQNGAKSFETNVVAPIDELSDGQKACLRLVHQHRSSKEIARVVGRSRHTVDQRIARACATLGVTNRRDAARLFAQCDPFIHEPSHIVIMAPEAPTLPDVDYGVVGSRRTDAAIVADIHGGIEQPAVWFTSIPLPLPMRKGDRNDLNYSTKLGWVTVIFAAAALISGILIAALEALGRLF
jgi:DNA-binding CsgD family transcriptional regulator